MKIGTYYYPDQWPRDQWARDLDNVVKMGLQLIHVGEFSWATSEPREDDFQLDWLDEVLRLAHERRLDVILSTPTAVIPAWLAHKHPDVFFTGNRFGGRRHANHLHPIVQERSVKIVQALGDRFGQHPAVIGWQIDNELGGALGDQSDYFHQGFRDWLQRKYGSIETLNDAWGCAFWNTFYTSFDQIKYPGRHDPLYRNQHENTDASRFLSWTFAHYTKLQADVLKPRIGDRWITTNFMPFFPEIDPGECKDSLSLWSWDTYPISGMGSAFKDESFRLPSPNALGFIHDQMRSFNGRWGLMEVQPGQINWSGYPVRLLPGTVRLLLWQAIAHGAEFVTVYRFRQPRFGIEMWHDGLVQWDGVTPSEGGRNFAQVVNEVKQLEQVSQTISSLSYAPAMADESVPSIGILHEHDQLYSYLSLPQAKRWSQNKLLAQWHGAAERLSLNVSVVGAWSDWSKLPVLIVPAFQMADDALVAKLYDYVRNGGHLITTARTAVTTPHGIAPEGLYAHRLFELIGSTITGYDSLPEETFGHVEMDGRRHDWGVWGDLIQPGEGVEVLGRYVDQYYAGTAAVVRNRYGQGTATHVGPIDEGSLADVVVEHIVKDLGWQTTVVPPRTKLHRLAGGLRVFLNFSPTPIDAPAKQGAEFLIGSARVGPADVAVWRE